MSEPAWSLHSQLKKDTIDIGDLPLCRVLVIKDAHYPWLLLVPRRPDIIEIIARRARDVAWPRPVWGVMPPLPHDSEEVQNFISALRRKIWLG